MVNDFGVLRTDLKYGRLIAAPTIKKYVPVRADRGLLRCPKFARRADDGFKFRPLPLLFARFIRHWRRSQTSRPPLQC